MTDENEELEENGQEDPTPPGEENGDDNGGGIPEKPTKPPGDD